MPHTALAALPPIVRPVGTRTSAKMGADWKVYETTNPNYLGVNLLRIPGVDDAVGRDYRHVMASRQPLHVRRFYNAAVWEFDIIPLDDGGIEVSGECLFKIDALTLPCFVSSVTRALEVLEGGVTVRPPSLAPPATPRSAAPALLHVVPAPG